MRSRILIECLLAALCTCGVVTAADPNCMIYVDAAAEGTNDGSSWTNAYRYLQDALADADAMAKPVEIRVAHGIYKPDQGTGITPSDYTATFQLLNGVTLKGGYAGLGHPDSNAWDPVLHETLLSGDLQGNDDFADINTSRDNSHHIVTADETDATAVLEAVTITHGGYFVPMDRSLSPWVPRGGAGIHNRSGSPTLRRCTFSYNLVVRGRGGAMLSYGGAAARLEHCTFQENEGGGVLCDHDSATVLTDCRFISNYGTAVRQVNSQPSFDHCSFTGTLGTALSLEEDSSAVVSNCLFMENDNAIIGDSVVCTDSVFTGNTREDEYGAVGIATGTFIRCDFRDNSGGVGGAIYGLHLTLEDCTFIRNSAVSFGAVRCGEGDIHGCLFAGNRATVTGVLDISEEGKLTNCTIIGNRSGMWGNVDVHSAETIITNCIIRNNVCQDTYWGEEVVYGATAMSFCCVAPPPWQIEQVECIDVDPCFVNPGDWDPNGTPADPNDDFWVDGDYHLKSQAGHWDPSSQNWVIDDVTSPCVDTGDPNSPIGDEPQPNGGRMNMGAYGGTAEASKSL